MFDNAFYTLWMESLLRDEIKIMWALPNSSENFLQSQDRKESLIGFKGDRYL